MLNWTVNEALAYAAGLIDGEGSIGLYYNKVHKNYQLRLQVQMCDKEPLLILEKLFGGTWFHYKEKPPRRAKWQWLVCNSKAADALITLMPFLQLKHKQAQEALRCEWYKFKGKKLTKEEQQLREEVSVRIKEYNKRGTN